ncbi:Protein of unknown function [Pyronema omphalodes CBS 100304]|uniref:Uncharacterized protein n=1 Tax=Pyronema omphalodes (strain CBS 100304) TaxID=1076935 RepID=U4LJW0_PYROM|nr:Protein of unknown function [Pyronema omphalodes CBS 100304]
MHHIVNSPDHIHREKYRNVMVRKAMRRPESE